MGAKKLDSPAYREHQTEQNCQHNIKITFFDKLGYLQIIRQLHLPKTI